MVYNNTGDVPHGQKLGAEITKEQINKFNNKGGKTHVLFL